MTNIGFIRRFLGLSPGQNHSVALAGSPKIFNWLGQIQRRGEWRTRRPTSASKANKHKSDDESGGYACAHRKGQPISPCVWVASVLQDQCDPVTSDSAVTSSNNRTRSYFFGTHTAIDRMLQMQSLPLTLAAFVAGLISFLSPCVLPLVPGYVSLISGASVDELRGASSKRTSTVMLNSIMFIAGFTIVFVSLGAAATTVGRLLREYKSLMAQVAGIVIILFGLHLVGLLKIKALYADKRMHNVGGGKTAWGAFAVGFAFAFGWTPCIGPILATILAIAGSQGTVAKGILLLAIYSLGLAVPFLVTSFGIDRFLGFYSRFRRHLHAVEVASGVLLIVIGALFVTRHFTIIAAKLSFLNKFVL
jgi:cytochrome c-type biogenesis protein